MGDFKRLVGKELRGDRGVFVTALLVTVVLEVFLLARGSHWRTGSPSALSMIPGVLLPAWMMAMVVKGVASEWGNNTAQFLLTLPVGARSVLGAKLAAVGIQVMLVLVAWLVIAPVVWRADLGRLANPPNFESIVVRWVVLESWKWLVVAITALFLLASVTALSNVAVRTVHRFGWVVGLVTFFGTYYIFGKVVQYLAPYAGTLTDGPTVVLRVMQADLTGYGRLVEIPVPLWPILVMLLFTLMFGIAAFEAAVWLWERKVEV